MDRNGPCMEPGLDYEYTISPSITPATKDAVSSDSSGWVKLVGSIYMYCQHGVVMYMTCSLLRCAGTGWLVASTLGFHYRTRYRLYATVTSR